MRLWVLFSGLPSIALAAVAAGFVAACPPPLRLFSTDLGLIPFGVPGLGRPLAVVGLVCAPSSVLQGVSSPRIADLLALGCVAGRETITSMMACHQLQVWRLLWLCEPSAALPFLPFWPHRASFAALPFSRCAASFAASLRIWHHWAFGADPFGEPVSSVVGWQHWSCAVLPPASPQYLAIPCVSFSGYALRCLTVTSVALG